MAISKDEARRLAKGFRDISVELGDFRFDNWGSLTPQTRRQIEDAEWTLLNYSSDLISTAVGLALQDMQRDLKAISDSTSRAQTALAHINSVQNVLTIAASLIALGGAIASGNPMAIAQVAADTLATISTIKPPKPV